MIQSLLQPHLPLLIAAHVVVKIRCESCAPLPTLHKSLRVGEMGGTQEEGGAAALHDMHSEETRACAVDTANVPQHSHK